MRDAALILLLLTCASCGRDQPAPANTEGGTSATTGENADPSESGPSDTSTDTAETADGDLGDPDQCDPFLQQCPVGEKCVPYSASGGSTWDETKCVPVMGEQAVGESCISDGIVEATDDCDATGFCFDTEEIDGELVGTCHAFCAGMAEMPECPEGQQCILSSGPVSLCFPKCDPTAQDCDNGEGCYWASTVFTCVEPLNPAPPGEPCRYFMECEIGSTCIDGSSIPGCQAANCCGQFCDLGLGDEQCAVVPGTTCVPFWPEGEAPDGYDHVGICAS